MISVIVPIYGVEKYIERCARSLFEQTYRDVEYIFVNDCTKDNSIFILKRVLHDYPNLNVTIINKKRNEGLPQARKTGILASHGEYVINFDSDDWVDRDCLRFMYECAKKHEADIVMSDYYEEYTNQQIVKCIPHVTSPRECIDMMLRTQLHSGWWNKLVRRELFLDISFPARNMHEDMATMVQVFSNANSVCYIHKAFYHYNLSNVNSLTQKGVSIVKTKETFENLKLLESFFTQSPQIHEKAFANFVNTFKGAMMMKKEVRNIKWLKDLYPQSQKFIFSECRLSLLKKCLLYGAYHNFFFPYLIIDFIRKFIFFR